VIHSFLRKPLVVAWQFGKSLTSDNKIKMTSQKLKVDQTNRPSKLKQEYKKLVISQSVRKVSPIPVSMQLTQTAPC